MPVRSAKRMLNSLMPGAWKRRLQLTWIQGKYHIHSYLGRYPAVLFPIYDCFNLYRDIRVSATTELVIEGFPRSATTFCYYAFQVAQGYPAEIAYHIHLPAHVIRAVRMNKPVLLLIREPQSAINSAIVREPYTSVRAYLKRYIIFYSALEAYRDRIVVADFKQAVSNFGDVIERLNNKYNRQFIPFVHSPENLNAVNELLDRHHQQLGGNALSSYLPHPAKEVLKQRVDYSDKQSLLDQAQTLYRQWSPLIGIDG